METTAPPAHRPQHMKALAQANQVRLARAELKQRIERGERSAVDVIVECPPEAKTMPVAKVLMCQPRWGRTRCRKFLASIPMSENKSVGSMTDRQRHTLAALLRTKPGHPTGRQAAAGAVPEHRLEGAAHPA